MKSLKMLNVKDLDREVVLRLNEKDFIQMSSLNKYFYKIYTENNYLLFKRRLQKYYSDTIRLNFEKGNWKKYYLRVIQNIYNLKEEYGYVYKYGNPFKQMMIFSTSMREIDLDKIHSTLYYSIVQNELALVKYSIENGNIIANKYDILEAASLSDSSILKYLIEKGADLSFFNHHYWTRISNECREFLKPHVIHLQL